MNFINNISLVLVCAFGSILYMNGSVNLGDLGAFIQYSRKFSGPINEIANIIAELQSAFAAAERVFTLIDAEPEAPDAPDARELTDVRGDVRFEAVDFSYDPGKPIIENLDLHARPGSLTAIVGPTGAGKTTIINLLMRFYDVDGGTVYVDGKDIRTLTRDSLRKAYTMVLQDTWLFCGSIYDNIAYGKEGATADEVMRFYSSVMRGEVKDQFGLEAQLSDRLAAGKELMKRFSAVDDKQKDALARLDALFEEFRNAVNAETN